MKKLTKSELTKLVNDTTVDTYEDLAPELMKLIHQAEEKKDLTGEQLQAELMLSMMAYIKSCTSEILTSVLADVLELPEESGTE